MRISYTPSLLLTSTSALGILTDVTSCTHCVPFHQYAPYVSARTTFVPSGAMSMPTRKPPAPMRNGFQVVPYASTPEYGVGPLPPPPPLVACVVALAPVLAAETLLAASNAFT